MKSADSLFKTFPEFSELNLEHRDAYNKLIAKYPPISEISFASLMTWWSPLGNCKISMLNNNLVIAYWMPGDERNSGLSLIGTNKIDETICEIFDYQKSRGDDCRLVHVPQFVVSKIKYPEMYECNEEVDYNEYIIPFTNYTSSEKPELISTKRIQGFLKATKGKKVELSSLDLDSTLHQHQILKLYRNAKKDSILNALPRHAEEAFLQAVRNATSLQLKNLCILVDGQIESFSIYQTPKQQDYIVLNYACFNFKIPGIVEFSQKKKSEFFVNQGAEYLNMAMHLGDPRFRSFHLAHFPVNCFRKYTLSPWNISETTRLDRAAKKYFIG